MFFGPTERHNPPPFPVVGQAGHSELIAPILGAAAWSIFGGDPSVTSNGVRQTFAMLKNAVEGWGSANGRLGERV